MQPPCIYGYVQRMFVWAQESKVTAYLRGLIPAVQVLYRVLQSYTKAKGRDSEGLSKHLLLYEFENSRNILLTYLLAT